MLCSTECIMLRLSSLLPFQILSVRFCEAEMTFKLCLVLEIVHWPIVGDVGPNSKARVSSDNFAENHKVYKKIKCCL